MSGEQQVPQAFVEDDDISSHGSALPPTSISTQTESNPLLRLEKCEEIRIQPPGIHFHEEESDHFEPGNTLLIESVDGTEIFPRRKGNLRLEQVELMTINEAKRGKLGLAMVKLPYCSVAGRVKTLSISVSSCIEILPTPTESSLLPSFFSLVLPTQLFDTLTQGQVPSPNKQRLFDLVISEKIPPVCVFFTQWKMVISQQSE